MAFMPIARCVLTFVVVFATATAAQTPQPFPRPGGACADTPCRPTVTGPTSAGAAAGSPGTGASAGPRLRAPAVPALSVPMYPSAQYLTSYEAGRGQRYYIFGTTAPFADLVNYYRTQLKDRGNLVFEEPPTHMFEIGRFREESMTFPPSVTIKDWTFGRLAGIPQSAARRAAREVPDDHHGGAGAAWNGPVVFSSTEVGNRRSRAGAATARRQSPNSTPTPQRGRRPAA